ncbi:hypothetical protein GP486_008567 [Trichoglossum hirsutum]|uniref:Alcohol dehydrogenase-like C-terminal domain-containing protein n=1 Tax=Trichoglossum hirsutum TaxID=265104 RepID=A0A9P8L4Q9_9PEZI|nr:hypothetical protein GP486_008567 [Trichoglossum hirsutum]
MGTAGGSYAEYAVAWEHTTFRIPEWLPFEAAATIPLAAFTAAVGLFLELGLPAPWERPPASSSTKIPLLINGASSATGLFAVKLAQLSSSSIGPIICTAGRSASSVTDLGGDDITVLDYRSSSMQEDIQRALQASTAAPLRHVLDTANSPRSAGYLSAALAAGSGGGACAFTQKWDPAFDAAGVFGRGTRLARIWVGTVHDDTTGVGKDFGFVWAAFFARLLRQRRLEPHPYQLVPRGLHGVEGALRTLMERKEGNAKFVFR